MLEALGLTLPELALLSGAAVAAGLVRGFTGFGTALVFLPFAGQVLSPFEALTVLIAMDLIGPLPALPGALRVASKRDLARLAAGLVLCLPLGLLLLRISPPEVFRYAVSIFSLLLLAALISGWRLKGALTPPKVFAAGAAGGLLGGISGLVGPPVILAYMASRLPVEVVRGTITLYLVSADAVMIVLFILLGTFAFGAVLLGLALIPAYMLANWVGTRLFRPEREATYRRVAYLVIALSALLGLPLWET